MGRCSPLGRHGCRRLPHVVFGLSSPLDQHGCRGVSHVVRSLGASFDLHYETGFGLLVDLVQCFDPGMTFLGTVDFLD